MAKAFDLEKRSTEFAKAVIVVCKNSPRNPLNDRIVGQVVGSSGSVGANYLPREICIMFIFYK